MPSSEGRRLLGGIAILIFLLSMGWVTLTGSGIQGVAPGMLTVNCASAASPAVCTTAPAGSVAVPLVTGILVVNTTAVTANSEIFLTYDSGLGTRLGITCNATEPALIGVTARTPGVSFTITTSIPVTNAACLNFLIVN